ncbi:hypothetical protein GBA52_018562 [Prunus armeniaca]|nr:hypothetical protein GBA52_018562 [Prunus armeniaca]
MATASLLQPNPLKWTHSSCPFLLPPLRPLPTKPIKFSSTFDVEQASCNFKGGSGGARSRRGRLLRRRRRGATRCRGLQVQDPIFRTQRLTTRLRRSGSVVGVVGFTLGQHLGSEWVPGSSFFLILTGFAAFVLVSGFLSDRSEGSVLTATEKTSVLKLQVGLLGMGRALQRDLNRIAETADPSTSEGLGYVLTETTLALLRHPDYCISGYSSVAQKRGIEDAEKRFNQLSIEERGKFDEETLVNVNNIKRQSSSSQRANGFRNEYIVITILVAAEGVHKLPTINGSGDLKEALQKLGSIPSNKILAVEVLWTPQNETDTLSERELLEDYPLLRPL